MNTPSFLVGLDLQPDSCRAVRMRVDTPRPEVAAVAEITPGRPAPEEFFAEAALVAAVPGQYAIAKNIPLTDGGSDPCARALFELAQSLTGSPTDYWLDAAPTGLAGLMLGMAVRRSVLRQELLDPLAGMTGRTPIRAEVRGLALAHGYLAFCRPSRGGVLVMIDQDGGHGSAAVLYRNRVVALAHVPTGHLDLSAAADRERYAVEIKTVVSFRLAALFDYGLTLPPSALVVSGGAAEEALQAALQKQFTVPIERPG
ncbi:MAG TPA: hypothetical protein PLR32_07070 [candidate division Zixibacteria bacterium]|nr:hypothetical protein [candidate division Zixibacteria bacterium]